MHLYDDIGDASLSLRGSTSSCCFVVPIFFILARPFPPVIDVLSLDFFNARRILRDFQQRQLPAMSAAKEAVRSSPSAGRKGLDRSGQVVYAAVVM